MPPGAAQAATGAYSVAADYQRQVAGLGERLARTVQGLWLDVDPADVVGSWAVRVPDAVAAMTAAQAIAADMADDYADRALAAMGIATAPAGAVNTAAFAGVSAEGVPLPDLLNLPALRASYAMRAGIQPVIARTRAQADLVKYARTEPADAARLSSQVAGIARHVGGYIRHLRLPSCARCAILAGRWYRWSAGFARHPHCDCVHVPATGEIGRSLTTDPRTAILTGNVHGLTAAEHEAIRLGADPALVVNAQDGMYVAGDGRRYTTTGTTRRGVAGARLIAAAINRAEGGPTGRIYRNMTMDRLTLLEATTRYEGLLRRGVTFTRRRADGTTQAAAYRYSSSPRASVADLLATATDRDDAIRALINHGYIL